MAAKTKTSRASRKGGDATKSQKEIPGYSPHIVVKFWDKLEIFRDPKVYTDDVESVLEEKGIIPWSQLKGKYPGIDMRRLYTSVSPGRIIELVAQARERDGTYRPPNFLTYFVVDVPAGVNPDELAKAFLEFPSVETAYFDPPGENPAVTPTPQDTRVSHQHYLDPATAQIAGIDARFAWGFSGGDGAGQDFVDLERGWTLDHDDLKSHNITLLHGVLDDARRDHGTAVLGEVCAKDGAGECIGIAPHVGSVKVISYSGSTRADAILAASDPQQGGPPFGGVLLLEAEIPGSKLPIEVLQAEWDNIRLATALGITVIEAAGNNNYNLNTFQDANGKFVLKRLQPPYLGPEPPGSDLKDSGAIMVAACTADPMGNLPLRSRHPHSNYGSRIDCYAQGENVTTTWSNNAANTPTNLYTDAFGWTSSAAAIIAGAALVVQGMAQASLFRRFSPWQMRSLLSDPADGTLSANSTLNNPNADLIGVMPDLKKLVTAIGVAPDVYIRDDVGDKGDPHTGAISASPDIILRQVPVSNPQAAFGEGSGTENSNTLGDMAETGQNNYIYVRVRNRGGSPATNVTATVYWAPVSTLLTPPWTKAGQVDLPNVPMGNSLTVSDAIVWPSAPETGHYCFVGLIGNTADPAPLPADFRNWDNYRRFIRDNNNVTWCNFNVVDNVPNASGFVPLSFMAPGAPDEARLMRLEIVAHLPEGSRVLLEMPPAMYKLMSERGAAELDKKRKIAHLLVNPHGPHSLGEMLFKAKSRTKCTLLVQIPNKHRSTPYEVYVRQLYKGQEVGRVTWRLAPVRNKKAARRSKRKAK